MLAPALGRHIADGAFQNLQQRLLHALSAHVAGDRRVFTLAGDLVNLIDIDDALFRALDVKIGGLDQLQQDVLHILAHIAGLRQGGGVRDGKGHVQHVGQRLGQQRFAHARGAQQQHIAFLQFHVRFLAGKDTLIMIVHRHRQHGFRRVLADDILIQIVLDLGGRQDIHTLALCAVLARALGRRFRRAAPVGLILLIQQRVT